jgi:hypothetical protein
MMGKDCLEYKAANKKRSRRYESMEIAPTNLKNGTETPFSGSDMGF